jgi:hypothetical protein
MTGRNQLKLEVAFLLATFAGVFFIWFAATLSARLRAAEAEVDWLSAHPAYLGRGFVALNVTAAAVYQFVSDAIDDKPRSVQSRSRYRAALRQRRLLAQP